MTKRKIFYILGLILSLLSIAQTEAIATYEFKRSVFTTSPTLKISENAFLYVNYLEDEQVVDEFGVERYAYKDYVDWFLRRSDNQIFERREKSDYILNSSWKSELKWTIHEETKEISGYRVQKATTKSLKGGGLYSSSGESISYDDDVAIAWFTTELPFNAGPERYHGLPGLIVKLEYEKRKETCTLVSIDFQDVPTLDPPSVDGVLVSKNEIINTFTIDKKWLKKQMKLLDSGE